ncbi:TetR/AcrR family transcriptional regulator [Agromyces archimandritae]|uniref:TetR family transcriptional regulator n=1 Tax=Agromyces archimandritae TaxID=2781962 RepID=A0A975FJ66_9MICO|nr:TetR family transcriptional regulator [Agromyces archimandritae]QTX03483.1 TetR family transcriptional regulator [Agromyces archimandritae]
MVRNEERRRAIADAGVRVLADEGSRGLTHRAVDQAAGVPAGTTSNYFRSRDALIDGLVERIGERLSPAPETLERRDPPTRELFAWYLRDIVRRMADDREVTIALYELRLEATRRPELAERLGAWQRAGFAADVAFNEQTGLPATRTDVALFRYAIEGLLFDRLTTPIDPDTPIDDIVDELVARLLPR